MHDGIPRISSEGLDLVERGLKGDFSGWIRRPSNHPMYIPEEMLSNLAICADPETMDFLATPWYGSTYPMLDGLSMAPRVRFNGVDRKEECIPRTPTVALTYRDGSRSWEFMTDLTVGLDDLGCSHGCRYCYAPHAIQKSSEQFFCNPQPRPGIVDRLEKQLSKEYVDDQTLLSFVGDVYCESGEEGPATVRKVLNTLYDHEVPVAILTKGGSRCLRDADIFRKFGKSIMVGATLTFMDPTLSRAWEPNAALPQERLNTLDALRKSGIKTFASFEPVINPEESLAVMRKSIEMDCIDLYKIGKLNGMKSIEKNIDWSAFLQSALDMLRSAGKEIYVKDDLAAAAPDVELTPDERNADLHTVRFHARRSGDILSW